MQERNNKILAFSLAGLVTLLLVLVFIKGRRGVRTLDKEMFRVTDLSRVDKVVLRTAGKDVVLRYDGVRWRVNDRYNADAGRVTVLFATLAQSLPKRPVAVSLADSLSAYIRTHGVAVSLFEGEHAVKAFYAGGNRQKTEAYFQDADHGPYLMSIPGYRVYVAGIFELDEQAWRDRRIFDFNWRNFNTCSVAFSADSAHHFEIENRGSGFEVAGLVQTDTAKLNSYLDGISLLTADRFIVKGFSREYDSLMQLPPFFQIEVSDVGNKVYRFAVYPPLSGEGKVLGVRGKDDWVLFERKQISPLIRTRDYFMLR